MAPGTPPPSPPYPQRQRPPVWSALPTRSGCRPRSGWRTPGSCAEQYRWQETLANGVFHSHGDIQNGGFIGKIPLKWMIWGYPYFRKPPNGCVVTTKDTRSITSNCHCDGGNDSKDKPSRSKPTLFLSRLKQSQKIVIRNHNVWWGMQRMSLETNLFHWGMVAIFASHTGLLLPLRKRIKTSSITYNEFKSIHFAKQKQK